MDPATMGAVSIGSSLLSGALSGAGAATSASASADSFRFKAGIASMNATIAKQNAAYALSTGEIKAGNYGMRASQEIAGTKVTQAGSGLDVNSGTGVAVRQSQQDVAKFDQDTIRADATRTSYGYETKAASDTAEAQMDTRAASNAEAAGKLGILSSIIGTAGSVASKWTQGNTTGMFSSKAGSIGSFSDGGNDGLAPSWST